jgi:hypothetical protein
MNRYKLIILLGVLIGLMTSCSKDFLEADLQTSKRYEDGIKTATDMHNIVLGLFDHLNDNSYYGRDFLIIGEVRSDNAYNTQGTGRFIDVTDFDMIANDGDARSIWTKMYTVIQQCNIIINNTSAEGDADKIAFYKGQAHAVRALVYFDLNRLFGQNYVSSSPKLGVPIVTVFDPKAKNTDIARSTYAEVNAQIDSDFKAAISMMATNVITSKVEMNLNAAKALYARFLLSEGQYADAKTYFKQVIDAGYALTSAPLYQGSWTLAETSESIFELAYTTVNYHGTNSYTNMWAEDGYDDIVVNPAFTALFDADDVRKPLVTTESGYTLQKYPYDNKDHNYRLVHIGEMIVGYAEAHLRAGGAATDATVLAEMNKLIAKRHTGAVTAWTSAELTLANVMLERRKELSMEGHRYFDLLRTGTSFKPFDSSGDEVGQINVPNDKLAFPIPEAEMDANSKLTNQNPGY